jgi:micrococcal nuclease
MHIYRAKIARIVDGDTVDFNVDLGFNIYITIRTRLLDVDTPERGHPDWAKATSILTTLLDEQKDGEGYVIIETQKTGKYGRWLVRIDEVNESLAKVWPYE